MGFKIVKDHLVEYGKEAGWKDYVPMTKTTSDYQGGTDLCRTFDDDGQLYYEAACDDDESMERFHNWSMVDSGTVRSQWYDNEKQEWREFIS